MMMYNEPVDVIDNFFSFPFSRERYGFTPEIRISESEKDITIFCGLPGVKREDLNVEVKNNTLLLSYNHSEISDVFEYKRFTKQWTLNDSLDQDAIKASYNNGILSVVVPKKKIIVKSIPIETKSN